jgi:hypothetical protein
MSTSTYDILTPEFVAVVVPATNQEVVVELGCVPWVDCPRYISTSEVVGCLSLEAFVIS